MGVRHECANQLWRWVPEGYIQSKHGNNLVLDFDNLGNVIVAECTGEDRQKWNLHNHGFLVNKATGKVMSLAHQSKAVGAAVILEENAMLHHMKWNFFTVPDWVLIKSCTGDLVLDSLNHKTESRIPVVLSDSVTWPTSFWQFEPEGLIAWKAGNNMVLDVHKPMDADELQVFVAPRRPATDPLQGRQVWELSSDGIIKNTYYNLVMDVHHAQNATGARVILWQKRGKPNQTWKIVTHP